MKRYALLIGVILIGCDGKRSSTSSDPIVTPTPIDPETAGTIKGKVTFSGTPPANPKLPVGGSPECSALHSGPAYDQIVRVKDGRLENAFVYVKTGLEGKVFAWETTAVRMSNQKCMYVPRVIGARVRQPIDFVNEDPGDHNIHGYRTDGEFNFTLRGTNARQSQKVLQQEVMLRVRCDLHPWMSGYIGVLPHPFFQVTGPDGGFELKGLPPGDYVIEAWHERFGQKTQTIKLDPKGSPEVEFSFSEK